MYRGYQTRTKRLNFQEIRDRLKAAGFSIPRLGKSLGYSRQFMYVVLHGEKYNQTILDAVDDIIGLDSVPPPDMKHLSRFKGTCRECGYKVVVLQPACHNKLWQWYCSNKACNLHKSDYTNIHPGWVKGAK